MNPSLLSIVAAYQQVETARLASAKAEAARLEQDRQALLAHADALLTAIVTELEPAFQRALRSEAHSDRPPYHAMKPFSHTPGRRSYRSASCGDRTVVLEIRVENDGEVARFHGQRRSPSSNHGPFDLAEVIFTPDQTEFKVWLAAYLGMFIARYCA